MMKQLKLSVELDIVLVKVEFLIRICFSEDFWKKVTDTLQEPKLSQSKVE